MKVRRIKPLEEEIIVLPDGRMTMKDACKYIGCSRSFLVKAVNLGTGPTMQKVLNKIFFNKLDIDRWIEQQKVTSMMVKASKSKEDK